MSRGYRGPRGHSGRGGYSNGRRHGQDQSPPRGRPSIRDAGDWHKRPDVTVKIRGLPPYALTSNVFDILSSEGNITKIDLVESADGTRTGEAFVTFRPPPSRAFWDLDWKIELDEKAAEVFPLTIALQERKRVTGHPSPLDPSKIYPDRMIVFPVAIDIGFMHQPHEMMVMQSIKNSDVNMQLNLIRREVIIEFSIVIPDPQRQLSNSQKDRIRFQIPFHQLDVIWEIDEKQERSLVITLGRPPAFYRKLHDTDLSFDEGKHWQERFLWARMTEIRKLDKMQEDKPIRLRNSQSLIDIGRWTTYRLTFNDKMNRSTFDLIKSALGDYNVKFLHPGRFKTVPRTESTVWDWIDLPESTLSTREAFLEVMSSNVRQLPWPVRYQLESCISQGCLNERDISKEFVTRLESMSARDEREALAVLEAASDRKKRIFNPMDVFEIAVPRTSLSRKMPGHCMLQRSATITPTTMYLNSPTVEMSNRILRQYKEHSDRFLRVRFTDERSEGRIHASDDDTQDAVFTKVYNCLTRGIKIGDRHFEFLAMGNSQFREHGAFFFASTPTLTVSMIRDQLGKIGRMRNNVFIPERVVAKYASRLGQCFSTTVPIRGIKMKVTEIADVERNGHNFTDGVGKLSGFVAQMIATELNLRDSWEPPSLFQFRMGGIKGVVAVSPDLKGNEIQIRASQYKFAAIYEGLEIITWSSYSIPRLNRQLITVLRSLRIPDRTFVEKLRHELTRLEIAMKDEAVALAMLQEQIDFNQMTLTIANVMQDGFMQVRDPFAISILHLWRAWTTKQLKEKAALTIQQGAFLLGCTDETATLRGYFESALDGIATASYEDRVKALPEIFVQISDPARKGSYRVIEEICIVARNPSLHPGDIRVVRAVDNPKLRHLKDVVVFSQTGDRDIPNMCSGGDLDGDDFIVIWDKDLIPPPSEWNVPAMDFTPPKPKEVDSVTLNDLVSFFVMYMKTDTLRSIATSHLANADQLSGGVRNAICLKLANEHSIAVDYPKSGIPPNPIHKLRPFKYPHFMTNRHRAKDRIYHSESVLGKLYDHVPQADFRPMIHHSFDRASHSLFDKRLLDAFVLDPWLIEAASEVKAEYDTAMRRIMAQHEIATEFEVWTTFVMDHAQLTNDYKFHEEIGRVSTNLKDQFTAICHQRAGGKEYDTIAPFVAAMYTVTANEMADSLEASRADGSKQSLPFISFPWLFQRELGKIARGPRSVGDSIIAQQGPVKRHARKIPKLVDIDDDDDDNIETEGGVTHRGDVLALPGKDEYEEQAIQRRHAAMVDDNIWNMFTGPNLDGKAAARGAFEIGTLDYGGEAMEQDVEDGEIEDGEIMDDSIPMSSAMDGVEQMAALRSPPEIYGKLIADDEMVDEDGEDYEGSEEVMIDIDDEPSSLDKLQQILSR